MRTALDLFEMEVLAGLPPIRFQATGEVLDISQCFLSLAIADIEPYSRALPDLGRVLIQISKNALMVPPDAGRHHR